MTPPSEPIAGEPRFYAELADWWPLFSPPPHYVEEAAYVLPILMGATSPPPRTLLELGSGGGSMAYHIKPHLQLTLSDRSPGMLAASRAVNPECEHVLGDMRTLRLGRHFDVVFIHDAICYMTDRGSLQAALATAYEHCRPGGAVVVMPDEVRETFAPETEMGGEDGSDGRGLRYLEWSWDPDPGDETTETVYAFLLREADGTVRVEGDRHQHGLFPRAVWLETFERVGLAARAVRDPWGRDIFVATPVSPSGRGAPGGGT